TRARQVVETLPRNCPLVLLDDERNEEMKNALAAAGFDVFIGSAREDDKLAARLGAAVMEALIVAGLVTREIAPLVFKQARELTQITGWRHEVRYYVNLLSANDPEACLYHIREVRRRVNGRAGVVYFHRADR